MNAPVNPSPAPASRILEVARRVLFAQGVNGMTMDALAHELGMSKKTLYVHFPGKDALLEAIVEELATLMQHRIEARLNDPSLNCTGRLCAVADIVGGTMARITPAMLRDLQRNAPAVYEKIDRIRQRNIPHFFGRIIRDGIKDGSIRADIDPSFATEFWLQAMRGMMSPETLERTGLGARQTLERGIELFFRGLLTPEGREQFATHQRLCAQHRNTHS